MLNLLIIKGYIPRDCAPGLPIAAAQMALVCPGCALCNLGLSSWVLTVLELYVIPPDLMETFLGRGEGLAFN